MRILYTGSAPNQLRGSRLEYESFPLMLAAALREAGHEVDHRPVTPGESLDEYERAIVGLGNPLSMGARTSYGALWALAAAPDRAVTMIDDADLGNTLHVFGGTARRPDYLWRVFLTRDGRDVVGRDAAVREALERASAAIGTGELLAARPLLVALLHEPAVERLIFGSPLEMRTTRVPRVVWLDPRCLQRRYERPPGAPPRERRWVHAALARSANEWFDGRGPTGWPAVRFGAERRRAGQGSTATDKVVEPRLVEDWYATSAGVVVHPYRHAGAGWWRARYLQAADVGAVVAVVPEEAASLGVEYRHSVEEYEAMTDSELADVAASQLARQESSMMTRDALHARLAEILSL